MKSSELFELFRGFSDTEVKEFCKFLSSPFFDNAATSLNLYREIIRIRKLSVYSDTEKLRKKICRKFGYSQGALSKQLTYLSKSAIKYLTVKVSLSGSLNNELNLFEDLLKRRQYGILGRGLKNLSDKMNKLPVPDEDYFLDSFRYNVACHDYYYQAGFEASVGYLETETRHLNEAASDAALFALIKKTIIHNNLFILDVNIGNKGIPEFPFRLDEIYESYFRSKAFKGNSTRELLFELYRLQFFAVKDKEKPENYRKYKEYFYSNRKYLSRLHLKSHFRFLASYSMSMERLNLRTEYFRKESVALYYDYFSSELFGTGKEYIHMLDYANFIVKAFSIDDLDIINTFIEKYSAALLPQDRDDMINYGRTYYYFGLKEYRKALKCINSIPVRVFHFRFDILNLELRIYYETGREESLRDAVHNYRNMVVEDKALTDSDKSNLYKMLNYLNQLIRINGEQDAGKRALLAGYVLKTMNKEPFFSLKKWLTRQYETLCMTDEVSKNA